MILVHRKMNYHLAEIILGTLVYYSFEVYGYSLFWLVTLKVKDCKTFAT